MSELNEKLATIDITCTTNQQIVDLLHYISKNKLSWKEVVVSLGLDVCAETFRRSCERAHQEALKYRGSRKKQRSQFLSTKFIFPKRKKIKTTASANTDVDDTNTRREDEDEDDGDAGMRIRRQTKEIRRIRRLEATVKTLRLRNIALQGQNKKLREQLETARRNNDLSKVNQLISRKTASINLWKQKYKTIKKKTKNTVETKLKEVKKEKTALVQKAKRTKERYLQGKENLKQKVMNAKDEQNEQLVKDLLQKKEENDEKSQLIYDLQVQLKEKEAEEDTTIRTKLDGKTYNPMIRLASYELRRAGVSQARVSTVLENVHGTITNKNFSGPLPSYSTQNRMATEMKVLSKQQVADFVGVSDSITVKFDGTTKKIGHLVETELESSKGVMLAGMKHESRGTAEAYLNSIQDSLSSIDELTPSDLKDQIKNTMSDRTNTNIPIEKGIANFCGVDKLNNFKCGLHPLDTIANEAEKCLKSGGGDGDSPTLGLIRNSSKLFHSGRFATPGLAVHMREKGVVPGSDLKKRTLMARYVGNRFHVMFLNAGNVFYYKDTFTDYFDNWCPADTKAQKAVVSGLKDKDTIAALRALGIFGKLVSGPWMRMVGDKSILELNDPFQHAYQQLKAWEANPNSLFLKTKVKSVFGKHEPIAKDDVFQALYTGNVAEAKPYLLQFIRATICVFDRQLKDHLIGGKLDNPTESLKLQANRVSATNISGERRFGIADQILHRAPGAKPAHVESRTMYISNKTDEYLKSMDKQAREKLVQDSIPKARLLQKEDRRREKEVVQQQEERIVEQRTERLEKEDKQRDKFQNLLKDIAGNGLWETAERVDECKKNMKKTAFEKALKTQLSFRSYIFDQKLPKGYFVTKCSTDLLCAYLKSFLDYEISKNRKFLMEILTDTSKIQGMEFVHKWEVDNKTESENGKVISVDGFKTTVIYEGYEEESDISVFDLLVDMVTGDLAMKPVK